MSMVSAPPGTIVRKSVKCPYHMPVQGEMCSFVGRDEAGTHGAP